MNSQIFPASLRRWARITAALCAGVFLVSTAPAQPTGSASGGRFLLIFDTSSAMKKRLHATQYAVERLFFSMMNGQLYPGDTIGVWTFNRKLRAGDFPLQPWLPQNAALIASNINHFVRRQHYARSTRLDVVMPDVNRLVRSSKRLTVLIFCDSEGEIKGTPYDQAINGAFHQNERAFRKADQTCIVVLRSQLGQYTGYTVNSAARGVDFPKFPPLPAPPPKTNAPPTPKKTKPPPPVVELPPLVIVGTNVSSGGIPLISPQKESSNPPPVKAVSNRPPVSVESHPPPATASLTNITKAKPPPMTNAATNAPPPPAENPSGLSRSGAMAIGAALLVAAVGLIIVALARSRKPGRGSLISGAMKKK